MMQTNPEEAKTQGGADGSVRDTTPPATDWDEVVAKGDEPSDDSPPFQPAMTVGQLRKWVANLPEDYRLVIRVDSQNGGQDFSVFDWYDSNNNETVLRVVPATLLDEMANVATNENTLGEIYDRYTTFRFYKTASSDGWLYESWPESAPFVSETRQHGYVQREKLPKLLDDPGFSINRSVVTDDPVVLDWLAKHPVTKALKP